MMADQNIVRDQLLSSIFAGRYFDSFEEVESLKKQLSEKLFYRLVYKDKRSVESHNKKKGSIKIDPQKWKTHSARIVCSHHGCHRDRSKGMRVIKKVFACGCPFEIFISFDRYAQMYKVQTCTLRHEGHPISSKLTKISLVKDNLNLNPAALNLVEKALADAPDRLEPSLRNRVRETCDRLFILATSSGDEIVNLKRLTRLLELQRSWENEKEAGNGSFTTEMICQKEERKKQCVHSPGVALNVGNRKSKVDNDTVIEDECYSSEEYREISVDDDDISRSLQKTLKTPTPHQTHKKSPLPESSEEGNDCDDTPVLCGKCGKQFVSLERLRRHALSHSSRRRFMCNKCPMKFSTADSLKRHLRRHTGIRDFVCSRCAKSFIRSDELIAHEKLHFDRTRFPCPVCKKGFTRHVDMLRHQSCHKTSKPYKCPVCHKSFARSEFLIKHESTHLSFVPILEFDDFPILVDNEVVLTSDNSQEQL